MYLSLSLYIYIYICTNSEGTKGGVIKGGVYTFYDFSRSDVSSLGGSPDHPCNPSPSLCRIRT